MIKRIYVIINEQHALMPDQERLLRKEFPGAEIEKVLVPAGGWTLKEIREKSEELFLRARDGKGAIVMASPIPAMVKLLAERSMLQSIQNEKEYKGNAELYILHNDRREKKELPNGKVIMVIAQTGWQLV